MRDLALLVWLMQLGLSVAAPLAGFILLALWLQQKFGLGSWVIVVAVIFGIAGAVDGLKTSLHTLEKLTRKDKEQDTVSFNDHE